MRFKLLDVSLHHQARPDVAARAVLEAVLARTAVGDGALATLHEEIEQSQSSARLLPAYEDAYAHLLDPDALDRVADTVRAALGPDAASAILDDDAWPNLAALLARHQRCGASLLALLRREAEDLHGARSPAILLYWRLGEPTANRSDPRLPAWITPPPTPAVKQPNPPPAASTVEQEARKEVIDLNTKALGWWQQQAAQYPWADRYLRERGFTPPPEHGVAPPGWTGLVEYLRSEGVSDEAMLTAGLATRASTGKLFDRFRDRLLVPVRDGQNAIIAFTARANPDTADERTPKWLNPPATPAYVKRQVLLGLDADAQARLRAGARPVFVEGALDLEAIRRLGEPDLVPLAGCGTALTAEHLQQVRDLCPDTMRAVFVFDADTAGARATARAWPLLTDAEASLVTSAILPTGIDPAEMLQHQRLNLLRAGIQVAQPTAEALLDQLLAETPHEHAEQRVATLRAAAGVVARLSDQAFVEVGDYLATQLTSPAGPWGGNGLDRDTIWAELQHVRAEHRARHPRRVEPGNPAVAAWLQHRADQIVHRLDTLVRRVAERPPAWAADLPPVPPPEDPARSSWERAVRAIVAYRDRYEITDRRPLGSFTTAGAQRQARLEAESALRTLGVDPLGQPSAERAAKLSQAERLARQEQMLQHLHELRATPADHTIPTVS